MALKTWERSERSNDFIELSSQKSNWITGSRLLVSRYNVSWNVTIFSISPETIETLAIGRKLNGLFRIESFTLENRN